MFFFDFNCVFMGYKIGDVVNIKITEKFAHFKITGSLTILFDDLSKYIATDLTKPYVIARILKPTNYYNDYYDDEDDSTGLLAMKEEPKNNKFSLLFCYKKKINFITLHMIELKYKTCIRRMFMVPYGTEMYDKWCDASKYVDSATAMNDYFEKVKIDHNENSLEMHKWFNKDHFVVVSDCYVEVNPKKYVLLQHSNVVCSGTYYEIMDKINDGN